MKKVIFIVLLMIGFISTAYADFVTIDAFVTNDDVTLAHLDNFRSTVVDAINNADGENIQDGTISAAKLDANTNPQNRWNEAFNDFVYTGLLPPTATGLTSVTTAGTAYISGKRVVKDATSKTYTASKYTYVDLSSVGVYTYQETSVGATEPATTTDSIRLARVTTNATDVTAVRDDRVTAISVGANEDFYISGFEILSAEANSITVDPGLLRHGTGTVEKVSDTSMTLSTSGDWWDGVVDTGAAWCYIGVDSSSNIKFLGNNPPDKTDTDGNTAGFYKYWYDTTNTKYWRVIGRVRIDANNQFGYIWSQYKDTIYYSPAQSFTIGTSTQFLEVDLSSLVSYADGEIMLGATISSADGSFISYKAYGDLTGERHVRPGTNDVIHDSGWFPTSVTSDVKSIIAKTSGQTATGYVEAVKLKIR